MKKYIVSFYFFLLISGSVFAAESGDKEKIGIDFFTKVKTLSNLKEHNGEIFVIVGKAGLEDNNYSRDLYQLKENELIRLTVSKNVSDYHFVQDGVIFRNIRDEKDKEAQRRGEPLTVFQQLRPGLQEATEWLRLPYSVGAIEFINDRRFFFTSTYDHHFNLLLEESNGNREEALKKKNENKNYRIFDELPFWSNGRGDISGSRSHLYYYNNGDITLLSDTFQTVSGLELSPDKKTLFFTQREYYGKAPVGNQLISLDVETQTRKQWDLFPLASYGSVHFANNNEIILTINRSHERDINENSGFYKLNLTTGEVTEIYNGEIYGAGNSVGSDIKSGGFGKITSDEKGIRYVSTVVDQAPLIHISYKDAKVTFLIEGEFSVQEYVPYKDGFIAIGMKEQQGNEIFFINKKGKSEALTSINKELFDTHQVVKPIEVEFTNEEGRILNGYVLPPANYEKGKKYPAILNIHGGPKSTYGTVFFHEMQYWANEGYAVLFTNPTGSDGRGSEFANIRGKYGAIDYNDIITFLDTAIVKTGIIDENRLGVTGGSYGGFMTNWIIGHTDRFKAAASQRSIASWISISTTSDIGHTFTLSQIGGDAWTNPERLWDQSPLKYADKVKTPTLFIHSEEDYRTWLVEGIQMYYALQYFEVPSRLVIFKNENHNLSRSGKPKNRIKRLDEITRWFDHYLKY